MNWQNVPDGYQFRIYFKHGGDESLVVETIKCSLEDPEFEKIKNILEHLKSGISKYFEEDTEKVAQYIAKKTQYNEKEIMTIIEKIVFSDIKWDQYIAEVDHIEIYRFEDGKVQVSQI